MLPGKTYIIYDVTQSHGATQWWMSEDVITFDVVSRDPSEIQTIINLITDFFRRYDDSAKDVNLSLISTSPYIYHYFKVESSDPVQAFANEGGFMNGMISVRYSYSRELDPITGRYKNLVIAPTLYTTGPVAAIVYDSGLNTFVMYLVGRTVKPAVGDVLFVTGNSVTWYNNPNTPQAATWNVSQVVDDDSYNSGGTKLILDYNPWNGGAFATSATGTGGTWTKQ
jgi:hypothetical protein